MIIATQHILFWGSAYVLASEAYLLIERDITPGLLPTTIVLLASVSASSLSKLGRC